MKLAILGHMKHIVLYEKQKNNKPIETLNQICIKALDTLLEVKVADVIYTTATSGTGLAVAEWAHKNKKPFVLYMPANILLNIWDESTRRKYFFLRKKALDFIHMEREFPIIFHHYSKKEPTLNELILHTFKNILSSLEKSDHLMIFSTDVCNTLDSIILMKNSLMQRRSSWTSCLGGDLIVHFVNPFTMSKKEDIIYKTETDNILF